jgi:hypothetical protein
MHFTRYRLLMAMLFVSVSYLNLNQKCSPILVGDST